MKTRLKIALVLAGIAALSLSELALMFWLGASDVEGFCDEIEPGSPVARIAVLAKKYGVSYRLPGLREDSGAYLAFVNTSRSYGRHTCIVKHDNNVIIGSHYQYAD